ncbi:hypothetical protein SAMN03159496_03231 [Rhizobium sp. NFR07]|uniref:hypothetical protein n=1 Tax=Rhizobium sp. NFR07 TaxID=1566262 RepID=UPI0008E004D4|nr:hypothetical protein [Rhizobium sp. NFR07]SFB37584.1 hypothetical protein SAMN03159496_03231 [Rhizobium sp. NFR07]
MTATKDQFFKPGKMSAQAKAEQTNSVVRDILDAEVSARDKKTEKLRALRLAQQEEDAARKLAEPAQKKRSRASATK